MTQNIQQIREELAKAEVGDTVTFNGSADAEVFHKILFPFIQKLEAQGDVTIAYTHRENRTGRGYIFLAVVKRLR